VTVSGRAVPRVILVAMDPAAASARLAVSVAGYARLGTEVGWWPADTADLRARRVVEEVLPQGLETPGHLFWAITLDDGAAAGWLWVGPSRDGSTWWIYDIEVDPSSRGRGVGAGALRALDRAARAARQPVIGLHVLIANETARALYLREGFVETAPSPDGTGVVMEKRLIG